MNLDKGFVPKNTDEQKLASIRSQRESIAKILEQLAEQELEIVLRMNGYNTDNNEPDRKD